MVHIVGFETIAFSETLEYSGFAYRYSVTSSVGMTEPSFGRRGTTSRNSWRGFVPCHPTVDIRKPLISILMADRPDEFIGIQPCLSWHRRPQAVFSLRLKVPYDMPVEYARSAATSSGFQSRRRVEVSDCLADRNPSVQIAVGFGD